MKLIDSLKLKGTPAEIPDCSRDDLPAFFIEMGYKVGAEIGTGEGKFSKKLCQESLKLYTIDPWKAYDEYCDPNGQKWFDSLYEQAKKVLASYPKCKLVRKTSMEAVKDFDDESLDFVYIDANHQLKYIIEDLVEWTRKVRSGGIISGHDYIFTKPTSKAAICHVIYGLQAFTQAYRIDNWYILGRKERRDNEVRDRFRSWMFVKQ
jgi:hypothetical protein